MADIAKITRGMQNGAETIDNNFNKMNAEMKQKADKGEIDAKLSQISSVPETFANLAALQSTYPNGKTGLMVAADNGHKYIWANGTWTDAGIYQSVGIAENGLDLTKLSFNASELIGWDENAIGISPTEIQTSATPITITFNAGCIWTLIGNMASYINNVTVEKTMPDGYVLYLDLTKYVNGNGLTADSYIVAKFSDMPQRWNNILLACNFSGRLLSPVQALQNKLSRIYYGLKDSTVPVTNVITVGQGHEYTKIQDAVNAASDSKDNPITILIMPGIYNESVNVQGQRHLSLIGINKKTCIVRNDTGDYNNAPLEIEGDVMVKNLTFISTHDATTNVPVDSLRSYAVHADFDGAGTAEFVDCDMISMQNAAFGCGLHQDQTVKLIRCNLFSHTPAESSMLTNGSLFCHSAVAANTSNQHLIIDDCHIESDLSWAAYINDANQIYGDKTGADMDVAFYNTLFYSHEKGKTGVIHKDSGTGFSGTIKLSPMSYGNNLPELNV